MKPARALLVGMILGGTITVLAQAPVTAKLMASDPIKAGQTPSFTVMLTNSSADPVHVIAGGKADSLQRWYFAPSLTKDGKDVWLPAGCDLPAPPSVGDYTVIAPHSSYTFTLSHYSGDWGEIKPGIYRVGVTYRHYRRGEKSYTARSNDVALQVTP